MSPGRTHKWSHNKVYRFGADGAGLHDRRYAQIAEQLIQERSDSEDEDAALLPEERQLASRFGVSRSTIRNALTLLEKYGLVQRRRGHGTVLTRTPAEALQIWHSCRKRLVLFQFSPVGVRARDWYGHILRSILAEAKAHRQTVEIRHCLSTAQVRQELQTLQSRECMAGVILCGAVDKRFISACSEGGIPCVCVDYWPHDEFADAVAVDLEAEAHLAVSHLVALGVRSLGYVAFGHHMAGQAAARWDSDVWRFLQHLSYVARQHKIQMRSDWLFTSPEADRLGLRSDNSLLCADPLPQALICFHDTVADHVLDILHRRGLRCPQDICLISRGTRRVSKMQMTTLANSPEDIGRIAMRLALERVYRSRLRPVRVAVASRLIPGDSTRCRKSS